MKQETKQTILQWINRGCCKKCKFKSHLHFFVFVRQANASSQSREFFHHSFGLSTSGRVQGLPRDFLFQLEARSQGSVLPEQGQNLRNGSEKIVLQLRWPSGGKFIQVSNAKLLLENRKKRKDVRNMLNLVIFKIILYFAVRTLCHFNFVSLYFYAVLCNSMDLKLKRDIFATAYVCRLKCSGRKFFHLQP